MVHSDVEQLLTVQQHVRGIQVTKAIEDVKRETLTIN
jgi:hypothetical protein